MARTDRLLTVKNIFQGPIEGTDSISESPDPEFLHYIMRYSSKLSSMQFSVVFFAI